MALKWHSFTFLTQNSVTGYHHPMRFQILRSSDPLGFHTVNPLANTFWEDLTEQSGSDEEWEQAYWHVIIDHLDALIDMSRAVGDRLIVNAADMSIEIYDDHRE